MDNFKHDLSRREIEQIEAKRKYDVLLKAKNEGKNWQQKHKQAVKFERRIMLCIFILVIVVVWILS